MVKDVKKGRQTRRSKLIGITPEVHEMLLRESQNYLDRPSKVLKRLFEELAILRGREKAK